MYIEDDNIGAIYQRLCAEVMLGGAEVKARDLVTRELTNVCLVLTDPRSRIIVSKARDVDMNYLVGELCYFLDGRTDLQSIYHYSKFWAKVSDDGKTVNSAYGKRLFYEPSFANNRFLYALDNLRKDQQSRKAVMPIYTPLDSKESNDNPCTMFLQLLIRANHLDCYAFMRSNDVWLGVPYDVAFFTLVQEMAYVSLKRTYPDLKLGCYYHNVTSMHIYERNYPAAVQLVREPRAAVTSKRTPPLHPSDLDSWFDDLLTYEKSKRGVVKYRDESIRTTFQEWAKEQLT